MDRIDQVRSFCRAAETGSFSQAARDRGTTQPTISKQVAALEARLGVQLFARTTRKVSLTEAGGRYYEEVKEALAGFEAAEAAVREDAVAGTLRIGAPTYFGQAQIIPRLGAFLRQHEALNAEMVLSDAFLDPTESGVDLAVRVGELADSSLVARRVGTARRVSVASPDYVKRRGVPQTPEEIEAHDAVLYTRLQAGPVWTYQRDGEPFQVRIKPRVGADGSVAILACLKAGMGVGLVPLWLAGPSLRSGELVQFLEPFEPAPFPIHLVSPPRRYASPKAKAFADYLTAALSKEPDLAAP